MKTYISILRGINVSGHHLIKMEALRKSFEKLGFQAVTTYVQSGNVIFTSKPKKTETLAGEISGQIEKDYGFRVPVLVLSIDELRKIIHDNPLLRDNRKDAAFLHVTFLASTPVKPDLNAFEQKKLEGEEFFLSGNVVYLFCPNGYGKTKLNNSLFESKLQVVATTRNWKTTNELLKIAQQTDV